MARRTSFNDSWFKSVELDEVNETYKGSIVQSQAVAHWKELNKAKPKAPKQTEKEPEKDK